MTRSARAASRQASAPTRPFTLDGGEGDPLLREVLASDMQGLRNPLELLQAWSEALGRRTRHDGLGAKLDVLFRYGQTPRALQGLHHGVTLSMKTGLDAFTTLGSGLARIGLPAPPDPVQVGFGRLFAAANPWAGKVFSSIGQADLARRTEGFARDEDGLMGHNEFRRVRGNVANTLAHWALPWVMDIERLPDAPPPTRSWIGARGGEFIALVRPCVAPELRSAPVLDLNYRWRTLENGIAARLLRDQLVQIADGLYFGILFYATAHVREDFDPRLPDEAYAYRNFGYFLLMDDTWKAEKDRLFPALA